MKRAVLALAIFGAVGVVHADTIFDSIYSDAGQTSFRWYLNDKNNSNGPAFSYFNNKFFSGNKFDAGFFTTGASGTPLVDVGFRYLNIGTDATSTFNGTVEIFDTVNPEVVTNINSGSPVFSGLVASTNFTITATTAADDTGVARFSLSSPINLDANHAYGIALKINSTTVVPVFTTGDTYGAGTVGYAGMNAIHYAPSASTDGSQIPVWNAATINFNAPNQNLGFALYSTAAPVPEPATMAALGLGVAGMLRRRKRA